MIIQTSEKRPTTIEMVSCVGVWQEKYPYLFGNYFWISGGLRIINMWAENLKEISRREKLSEIECTIFSDGTNKLGMITDPIVPKDWLYDSLCVTGSGWGSRELCEYIHNYLGLDITNKICGCEPLTKSPSISKMFTFASKETKYYCSHCKRNWTK